VLIAGTAILIVVVLSLLAGYSYDTVASGSMAPEIGVGDLLISGPVDPEDIEVGDVIIFHSPHGMHICHRVISIDHEAGTVQTKGDANDAPDPYTTPFSRIEGKVIGNVPYLGYVASFLSSIHGLMAIAAIGIALFLFGGSSGKDCARGKDKG
jgi:signal peptidase